MEKGKLFCWFKLLKRSGDKDLYVRRMESIEEVRSKDVRCKMYVFVFSTHEHGENTE